MAKAAKSMKRRGMKAKKSMKKTMKRGRPSMKRGRKSIVARGKRAKSVVFRGTKEKTSSGLTKGDLKKNKNGRIVSRKASEAAKKRFAKYGLDKWTKAVRKARNELGTKGFCPVGGKTAKGKALLAKARAFYKKS